MDNQDLTLERRLKAKDKTIAELVEVLEDIVSNHTKHGWGVFPPEVYHKATEALSKAKGD